MAVIDLYANDGSPIGITPPDIYGRGVGGAELSMMTWAETMAGRGHVVKIYNNPKEPGLYNGVEYAPQNSFDPAADRDVFIVYRSPNPHIQAARAGLTVFWSTDQFTVGHFGRDVFPFVDRVVCISPYHVDYHKRAYGIDDAKIGYIDLGVRLQDYRQDVERIPGRCIFCSVPDRGLEILRLVWPEVKKEVPNASLVITSDYTLWGARPNNHRHRLDWLHEQDVTFLGKVDRQRLAREQMAAVVQSYPCTYEELFCISAAECQTAGAVPVTSAFGALQTTNLWGILLTGNPMERAWQKRFVSKVAAMLDRPPDTTMMQDLARRRFDWDRICGQWEDLFETGQFNVIPWEREKAA